MIGNKVKMYVYDNVRLQYTKMMVMDGLGSLLFMWEELLPYLPLGGLGNESDKIHAKNMHS